MKRITLLTAAALSFAACTPALAQMSSGSMSSDSHMKMSAADKKMMTKCQGMSHDAMMKNKGCAKMMKMHPDMMQSN